MNNNTISTSLSDISDKEAVSRFADSLIEEKGLSGLGDNEKAELKSSIEDKIVDTINQSLIYALPDDKFEELEKLADRDDITAEQVSELIANSGVDTQAVVTEAMDNFRQIFLNKKGEN